MGVYFRASKPQFIHKHKQVIASHSDKYKGTQGGRVCIQMWLHSNLGAGSCGAGLTLLLSCAFFLRGGKKKKKKKVEAYGKVPGDGKGRNKIVSQSPQKEQMPFI